MCERTNIVQHIWNPMFNASDVKLRQQQANCASLFPSTTVLAPLALGLADVEHCCCNLNQLGGQFCGPDFDSDCHKFAFGSSTITMISNHKLLHSPPNHSLSVVPSQCRRKNKGAGNPFSFLMMCCYIWAFCALAIALLVHHQTDTISSNNHLRSALSNSFGRKSTSKHGLLHHPSIIGTNEPKKCE
jgi:hypothetical protein